MRKFLQTLSCFALVPVALIVFFFMCDVADHFIPREAWYHQSLTIAVVVIPSAIAAAVMFAIASWLHEDKDNDPGDDPW